MKTDNFSSVKGYLTEKRAQRFSLWIHAFYQTNLCHSDCFPQDIRLFQSVVYLINCWTPQTHAAESMLHVTKLQCALHMMQNTYFFSSSHSRKHKQYTGANFHPYTRLFSIHAGYLHKTVPLFMCRPKTFASELYCCTEMATFGTKPIVLNNVSYLARVETSPQTWQQQFIQYKIH